MTSQQELQFNKFGCLSCSLIKLAEKVQKPVTKEEFCAQFAHLFLNPDKQYGLLEPNHIPEIARALNLPGVAGVPPTKLVWVPKYDEIVTLHRIGSNILVVSRINLNEGTTDPVGHCSLLDEIDAKSFTLWTSLQDGTDMILPPFPRNAWDEKQCQGMVLI